MTEATEHAHIFNQTMGKDFYIWKCSKRSLPSVLLLKRLSILRVTQGMSPYPPSHGKAHVKGNMFIWDDKRWIVRLGLNCGVGEDSWESFYCKEIQPVHPKGNESWIFIGRTDVEAETPILWPPDVKSWLIWKAPDAGKDWRREEKGITEDEMVGWHHLLNGHEFE